LRHAVVIVSRQQLSDGSISFQDLSNMLTHCIKTSPAFFSVSVVRLPQKHCLIYVSRLSV